MDEPDQVKLKARDTTVTLPLRKKVIVLGVAEHHTLDSNIIQIFAIAKRGPKRKHSDNNSCQNLS